jgi:hypothetical protein
MPSSDFDTPAKRFRLKPRKNPYWFGVSGGRGGLSLGFRRTAKGEGVWVAKIVLDGQRIEERVGTPDGGQGFAGVTEFRAGNRSGGENSRLPLSRSQPKLRPSGRSRLSGSQWKPMSTCGRRAPIEAARKVRSNCTS